MHNTHAAAAMLRAKKASSTRSSEDSAQLPNASYQMCPMWLTFLDADIERKFREEHTRQYCSAAARRAALAATIVVAILTVLNFAQFYSTRQKERAEEDAYLSFLFAVQPRMQWILLSAFGLGSIATLLLTVYREVNANAHLLHH